MNLRITPAALQDLKDIRHYIASVLSNSMAADSTIRHIMDDYCDLVDMPYMGRSLSSLIGMLTDYRYLVSGNYLIFYKVHDDFVEISRIIYGRRDYIKILFENEIEIDQ